MFKWFTLYKVIKYIPVLLILFTAYDTHACSCARQPEDINEAVEKDYNFSSSVVLAQAVSVKTVEMQRFHKRLEYDDQNADKHYKSYYQDRTYEGQETRFSVIKSWKGDPKEDLYTRIVNQCCLCGFSFEDNKKYLLYLYGPDKDGFYATSFCMRTTYA